MVDPYLGEIRLMSIPYAPKGWAECNGQLLPISGNQALFSLLGTQFGGNGSTTFGLPDLKGRAAVHADHMGYSMGQLGGEAQHTLTGQEMPVPHNHTAQGTKDAASTVAASGNVFANSTVNLYQGAPNQPIGSATVSSVGGSPHENMAPYQVVVFCIALVGIFPPRP
jgi:microcystin-dependent protein